MVSEIMIHECRETGLIFENCRINRKNQPTDWKLRSRLSIGDEKSSVNFSLEAKSVELLTHYGPLQTVGSMYDS